MIPKPEEDYDPFAEIPGAPKPAGAGVPPINSQPVPGAPPQSADAGGFPGGDGHGIGFYANAMKNKKAPTFNPGGDYGITPGKATLGLGGDVSGKIKGYLDEVMSGKSTRYSPEVMARLDAAAKSNAEGTAKASIDQANQDAVRRGVYRSPSSGRAVADILRSKDANFANATNQNQIAKVNADFQDRMAALDRSQKWLDDLRQYALGLDANDLNRQKTIAGLQLGYTQLDAARMNLQDQLKNSTELSQMNIDATKELNTVPITINGQTVRVPINLLPMFSGSFGG